MQNDGALRTQEEFRENMLFRILKGRYEKNTVLVPILETESGRKTKRFTILKCEQLLAKQKL